MKRLFVAAAAAAAVAAARDCSALEIEVLSAGAVKAALVDAANAWQRASSHEVRASFAPVGELRRRIAAGETADLVVAPAEAMDALAKEGVVVASTRRDLGAVAIGAAVREGAPVPDISTPEALRRTLLAAKSVTYMNPRRGTSGRHFDETVLARLGVRDEVRAKAVLGQGGYIAEKVASGEVEIAFHQMTELLPVKGVTEGRKVFLGHGFAAP